MADMIITNGTIYTMDPARPRARSVAMAYGRVVAFDDQAEVLRTPHTRVVDLNSRTLVPGFIDHHLHFAWFALGLDRVQLEGARSLDQAVARVAVRLQAAKPDEWILGLGWNHMDWARPEFPTKAPLDRIAPHNPVALNRKDEHSLWVNSAALARANITRETPDPPGGAIERDDRGEPTGLLRETAMSLISDAVGAANRLTLSALGRAIAIAHEHGLVGIHNVEGAESLRAFEELHARGVLTLRVTHMIPWENLAPACAIGLRTGLGDDWLRLGGVKIFADGSLGSQTAHMLEPFEGQPDNRGVAVTPPQEIERLARLAAQAGIMVVTHAIGDRAIRDVLDVYEKLRREGYDTVFRIEHVQHLDAQDLPRFKALNVIASMQPIHATSDYAVADRLLGARARYTYAFKSLLDSGATVIFGSDCPVETLDPIAGIHAAVTRQRPSREPAGGWYPQERLTVDQAVRAYSRPLVVGGLADAVVLSRDIFTVPPHEIPDAHVECTIVGGQVVFGQ